MRRTLALVSTFALLPVAAWGQTAPDAAQAGGEPMQPAGQRQVAEQCRTGLQAFSDRVDKEGYWLTGWRAGIGAAPPDPAATGAPMTTAAQPEGAAPPDAVSPWGNVAWQQAPGLELGTLYDAAYILAERGDEQGCQTVLAALDRAYSEYAGQLREAGVDPNRVSGWRAGEIVAAQPVSELGRSLRLDAIAGTDLRNPNDEYLGQVQDVMFDPQSGGIAYALVERGSFLGFGGETVAVPWERLKATPGLNLFVLNADAAAMEEAPSIEPGAVDDPARLQERRQEIDQYWQQRLEG